MHQAAIGFMWLLVMQCAGELLVRALKLSLPGPVLGMLLLIPLLQVKTPRDAVQQAAELILRHLSLLFVPVAVGVINFIPALRESGLSLVLLLVVPTWIGLWVTALVLKAMK